jgi:hypothetical protein
VRETQRGRGEGNLAGPFHLFVLDQGYVQVDFDEWLDFLAGGLLDDFSLAAFTLMTYRGKWHAMLIGRGKRGQAVPWAIDLSRERILFPMPRELMGLAAWILQ